MRIIEFLIGLGPGGVQSFIMDLSKEFCELNHTVKILTMNNFDPSFYELEKSYKNLSLDSMGISRFRVLKASKLLIKIIDDFDPDILHVHLRYPVIVSLLSSCRKKIPIYETYHSNYKNYKLVTKFTKKRVSKFIAVSEAARKELKENFKLPIKKIEFIPNGIDVKQIMENNSYKKAHIGEKEGIKFLASGRMSKEKGYKYLTKAFCKTSHSRRFKGVLQLIGNGPEEKKIKKIIKRNDCKVNFVNFLPRHKLIEEIQNSNVVIIPSLFEGLSIFTLEIMALGKPVIVTNIDSFSSLFNFNIELHNDEFKEFKCGIVVKPKSVESLAKAILYMFQHPENYERYSTNIRKLAQGYDISKTACSYLDIFYEGIT